MRPDCGSLESVRVAGGGVVVVWRLVVPGNDDPPPPHETGPGLGARSVW
jgi:hypothetical protein